MVLFIAELINWHLLYDFETSSRPLALRNMLLVAVVRTSSLEACIEGSARLWLSTINICYLQHISVDLAMENLVVMTCHT